jgi:hypothetical protein
MESSGKSYLINLAAEFKKYSRQLPGSLLIKRHIIQSADQLYVLAQKT